MAPSLADKALAFRRLHEADEPFAMANAWDAGGARLLETCGLAALATTSLGMNYARARDDGPGAASFDAIMAEHGAIARAVDLPVNGDLENGYGHGPGEVAACVRRAVAEGMAGGGIEDYTGDAGNPYYDIGLAAERVAAAREAADASGVAFTLTARAECFLRGHDDPLGEAVRRLKRFREAGAHCLYAPGPTDDATLERLVGETGGPLNVAVGLGGTATLERMARLGVRRISTGGSLFRATYAPLLAWGREMAGEGTFSYLDAMPDTSGMGAVMAR